MTNDWLPQSRPGADPVLELQIAIFGLHGHNGLYRSHKALAAEVTELKATAARHDDVNEIKQIFSRIVFLAKAVRWLVLGGLFLFVTLAPDNLAEKIAAALAAVKVLAGVL